MTIGLLNHSTDKDSNASSKGILHLHLFLIWYWVTACATIFWVRSDKFFFDVCRSNVSVQRIEYSPEYHCDFQKTSFVWELRVIRVPRFTEVRYHCRFVKSYRSFGPDLKTRLAGRCAAGKTVHAYGVAACNNSAIDYPGSGSRWKQVHFRKTALVLYIFVCSIYLPAARPPAHPGPSAK